MSVVEGLGKNTEKLYAMMLTHEYMLTDKIKAMAKEKAGLTDGQVDHALRTLRDAGWAQYAKSDKGNRYKWIACKERLLTPQGPGWHRRDRRSANGTDSGSTPLENMTVTELFRRIRMLDVEQQQVLAILENRLKLMR